MLTVRECEMDDQSKYTIVAEEGVDSSAQLTVECKFRYVFKIFLFLNYIGNFCYFCQNYNFFKLLQLLKLYNYIICTFVGLDIIIIILG